MSNTETLILELSSDCRATAFEERMVYFADQSHGRHVAWIDREYLSCDPAGPAGPRLRFNSCVFAEVLILQRFPSASHFWRQMLREGRNGTFPRCDAILNCVQVSLQGTQLLVLSCSAAMGSSIDPSRKSARSSTCPSASTSVTRTRDLQVHFGGCYAILRPFSAHSLGISKSLQSTSNKIANRIARLKIRGTKNITIELRKK
ncbi:hypothetical protein C8F04DRAFT_455768 [Mycena alexandri]|uniref:Uncharacterized protein n=1 Tax=Mycena alexandri TaxID=1745969 RepID=A0AAD6TKN9_9AGAR|nr:hypothetical protein C8F04DRAFT_455768 [Mycena alexandri]